MSTLVWQRACPCWDTFCPKKKIQGTDQLSHETSPGTSWLLPHQGQQPVHLQCTKAALFQQVHRFIVFLKTSLLQKA